MSDCIVGPPSQDGTLRSADFKDPPLVNAAAVVNAASDSTVARPRVAFGTLHQEWDAISALGRQVRELPERMNHIRQQSMAQLVESYRTLRRGSGIYVPQRADYDKKIIVCYLQTVDEIESPLDVFGPQERKLFVRESDRIFDYPVTLSQDLVTWSFYPMTCSREHTRMLIKSCLPGYSVFLK